MIAIPPVVITVVTSSTAKTLAISAASAVVSTVAAHFTQKGLNKGIKNERAGSSNPFAWKRPWQM